MNRGPLPLQQLSETAIRASLAAGQYIQSVDRKRIQRQHKDAGSSSASQLVTEIDFHSEAIIHEYLRESCKQWDIAFVGEESSHTAPEELPERLTRPYFWCVDPLDGTLPYVEGIPGYAVSIALVDQSGTPLIGVVYDPESDVLNHAIKGEGAYRNMAKISPSNKVSNNLMVFADASFKAQDNYNDAVRALIACAYNSGLDDIEIIYGNGAVKNACAVLDYSAACYVKRPKPGEGGGSIWDFAATACIVREAKGWASNILGESLDLNRRDSTFMNHQGVIYASSERLARLLIDSLSRQ